MLHRGSLLLSVVQLPMRAITLTAGYVPVLDPRDYDELGPTEFDRLKRTFVQDCLRSILGQLTPAMKRRV